MRRHVTLLDRGGDDVHHADHLVDVLAEPRLDEGSVLAQGGAVELKFPGKNFFRSIPSNYGPYKHPGAVFADFAAQVGFL